MREIKFRGKRVDNGEWVYGSYVYARTLKGDHFIVSEGGTMIAVIPETVKIEVSGQWFDEKELSDIVKKGLDK